MKVEYNKKKISFIFLFIFVFLGTISLYFLKYSNKNYYKKIKVSFNEEELRSDAMYLEFSIDNMDAEKYLKYDNVFTLYFNKKNILEDSNLGVIMDDFIQVSTDKVSGLSADLNKDLEEQSSINIKNSFYIRSRYDLEKSKLIFSICIPFFLLEASSEIIIESKVSNLSLSFVNKVPVSLSIDNDTEGKIEKYLKLAQYYINEAHMSYKNIFLSKIYFDKLIDCIIDNKNDIFLIFNKFDLLKIREDVNTRVVELIEELNFESFRSKHLGNYYETIKIYEELLSFYKKIYSIESLIVHQDLEDIRSSN